MKDYTDKYPLQVMLPEGEPKYMLRWYVSYQGHHVLLSKTLEGLLAMYRGVLDRHQGAAPKDLWRVQPVNPPRSLHLAYAQNRYDWDMGMLRGWVKSQVEAYRRLAKTGDLPGKLQRCKKWEPTDLEMEVDRREQREHNHCKNCFGGFYVEGYSRAEFFEKVFPAYDWGKGNAKGFDKTIRAPEAVEGQPLYMLRENHGHHRDGNVVMEVKGSDDMRDINVFFFFQGTELQGEWKKPFLMLRQAYDKVRDEEIEQVDQQQEKERKEYERKMVEDIETLFKSF